MWQKGIMKVTNSAGDRIQNLWFRRTAPYPLGHGVVFVHGLEIVLPYSTLFAGRKRQKSITKGAKELVLRKNMRKWRKQSWIEDTDQCGMGEELRLGLMTLNESP
jgi:hypothetical protein